MLDKKLIKSELLAISSYLSEDGEIDKFTEIMSVRGMGEINVNGQIYAVMRTIKKEEEGGKHENKS